MSRLGFPSKGIGTRTHTFTLLQELFYFGYVQLGIMMSEHRMLH